MCALRWTDLDLARGTMTVERSYAQTSRGRGEKATKSRQKRRIALDGYTVELLAAYRANCQGQCILLGIDLARDAFLFSGQPDFSAPLLPNTVTGRYRRLAQRLGLRSTRIHALRHYSATELITAGVDLRTVAGRLGHGSGGATTLRFYAAWVDESDRRAAEALAGAMPRPDPSRRAPRTPSERLAAVLRQAIEEGRRAPGETLPPVLDLAAEHGVSAGTVSRALSLLKQDGLIDVRRGKRAIVTANDSAIHAGSRT
jgi:DNA-binding transcriptional ArsR family regulator